MGFLIGWRGSTWFRPVRLDRILKDREHEEQRQNRSQIIQEGFQMLEEIDEAVTRKKALLEKMQDAFVLEPGEQCVIEIPMPLPQRDRDSMESYRIGFVLIR